MEFKVENGDGIDSWKEVTLVYSAALRQMETKMQILNDEFQHVHQYNPIEHIKARIKTPESIVKKLKRYGQESTIDNMVEIHKRYCWHPHHLFLYHRTFTALRI